MLCWEIFDALLGNLRGCHCLVPIFLGCSATQPADVHAMHLGAHLIRGVAVLPPVIMTVSGWGHPVVCKMVPMLTASLAFTNNAAVSVPDAGDITRLTTLASTRMGQLSISPFLPVEKQCLLARLCAPGAARQVASPRSCWICHHSNMALQQNLVTRRQNMLLIGLTVSQSTTHPPIMEKSGKTSLPAGR